MADPGSVSDRIRSLPNEKRRLLDLLLRDRIADPTRLPIQPGERETDVFELSFAQERAWVLSRLLPSSPWYNIPIVLRLVGALQVAVLARTLDEIRRRHEALRAVFPAVDRPVQKIVPWKPQPLPRVDLSG